MTMQLSRLAIAGFGGKGGGDNTIEDYLPIKEILAPDDPRALMAGYLGKKTYNIFQAVSKSKDVNPYMLKAFNDNKLLVDAMEILKNL